MNSERVRVVFNFAFSQMQQPSCERKILQIRSHVLEVLNVHMNEIFFPILFYSKILFQIQKKNKYYKFLKILYYFQYKPTNILIPLLVKKSIKETFRSFERSEFQAHFVVHLLKICE